MKCFGQYTHLLLKTDATRLKTIRMPCFPYCVKQIYHITDGKAGRYG